MCKLPIVFGQIDYEDINLIHLRGIDIVFRFDFLIHLLLNLKLFGFSILLELHAFLIEN